MGIWKPVLVGVDASPEAACAAALGWKVSTKAHVTCRLVHVLREPFDFAGALGSSRSLESLRRLIEEDARVRVEEVLAGALPDPVIAHLEVRRGSPAATLADLAREADLLVLGGKHHTAIGQWLVGSTVHQLVRTVDTPILVAGQNVDAPRRIFAAVDLSPAAAPTIEAAVRFATLFDADVTVLHVVEPLNEGFDPVMGPLTASLGSIMDNAERLRVASEIVNQEIWPTVRYARASKLIRQGPLDDTLRAEARTMKADWVVVGSHGRGWVDRMLLGSLTHRLLGNLPGSLLVVPVREHVARETADAAAGELAFGT